MGIFDKAKDMYKLQKQAKDIKKKLKNIHIEATEDNIVIVIDGHQEVVSVKINSEKIENIKNLENSLTKAFNKAIKKSQEIAAVEMKDVMGSMGLSM